VHKVLAAYLLEAIAGSFTWPITALLSAGIMLLGLKFMLRVKLAVFPISYRVKG
jgi:hypothetical protein